MEHRLPSQITGLVVGSAPLMVLLAYAYGGATSAWGAVAGGGVAVANWTVMRWVAGRIMQGSLEGKAGLMLLLVLKMGALMALCYVLITRFGLEPVGFAMGLGALVLGILFGSAVAPRLAASEEG